MTKILSVQQIQSKQFADVDKFEQTVNKFQTQLSELVQNQSLSGATNYGSYLNKTHSPISDIDAVLLTPNAVDLIQSEIFSSIINLFNIQNIDFSPVIVSPSDIETKRSNFSFMQPLKTETKRFIIGTDPVQLFFNNYSKTDQIRSLTVVIQDYNRQFIEPLVATLPLKNPDNLHTLAELVISGFRDSYRNLINMHSIQNNYDIDNSFMTFAYFQDIYPNFITTTHFEFLKDLEQMYTEYKSRILFYQSTNSIQNHSKEYQEFLENIISIAPSSIRFINTTRNFVLNHDKYLTLLLPKF